MKPWGITVSVGYGKPLGLALPYNIGKMDRLFVLTTPEDTETHAVCAPYPNVTVLKTDIFTRHGAQFNKGAAIECMMRLLPADQWVLVFDSDICFHPEPWYIDSLCPDSLYGATRYRIDDEAAFQSLVKSDFSMLGLHVMPSQLCAGFLQLFSTRSLFLQKSHIWYEVRGGDAGISDMTFRDFWPAWSRVSLRNPCFHLGKMCNWQGVKDWSFNTGRDFRYGGYIIKATFDEVWKSVVEETERFSRETGLPLATWRKI